MPAAQFGMKECSKCKRIKNVNQFGKRASASDGLNSWCKECQNAANKASREKDPERSAEYRRNYNREYMREYSKTDTFKQIRRRYYQGRGGEYLKKWRDENPEKVKEYSRKTEQKRGPIRDAEKRSQKKLSPEDKVISTEYRKAIANDSCYYCGQRTEVMHTDHKFPLSKGGTDHWWNLARSCSQCNLSKGARCDIHFRAAEPCDCQDQVRAA